MIEKPLHIRYDKDFIDELWEEFHLQRDKLMIEHARKILAEQEYNDRKTS